MQNLKFTFLRAYFCVICMNIAPMWWTVLPTAAHHVKDFMTDNQKALAYLKAGKIMHERGQFRWALECFAEGISCNPSTSLYNARAASYKSLNMWSEAYFDYSFAIRLEPENATFYCSRGMVLARMKRWQLALEDCRAAVNYQSTPFHHYCLGTVCADSGRNTEAILELQNCINFEACPQDTKLKALYRRAQCDFDLGRYSEAAETLTKLLNNDPNSLAPRALLSRTYKMLSDLVKAEMHISLAIDADPNSFHYLMERGDITFRSNNSNKCIEAIYDFDKAITLIQASIDKTREDIATWTHEDNIYFANGNVETSGNIDADHDAAPDQKENDAQHSNAEDPEEGGEDGDNNGEEGGFTKKLRSKVQQMKRTGSEGGLDGTRSLGSQADDDQGSSTSLLSPQASMLSEEEEMAQNHGSGGHTPGGRNSIMHGHAHGRHGHGLKKGPRAEPHAILEFELQVSYIFAHTLT